MQTEITDVNELSSLSNQLKTLSNQLDDSVSELNSIVRQARDYDGIDISSAGKTLRSNLKNIAKDMKHVSRNIEDYTTGIATLDQDDISSDADIFSLGNIVDNVGDFFVSTVDNLIVEPARKVGDVVENVAEEVIDVITTPVTLVTGTINNLKNDNDNDQ